MGHPLELPPDAVLVHVGPFKTGTTSIQTTLASSRSQLDEHGVDYPGTTIAHHAAARSLRRVSTGWSHDGTKPPSPQAWADLVQHVRSTPGRVVISSEFLGDATPEERSLLVRDLGPERVHVVAAARHVGAIAVSMWQQVLKEGHDASLDTWLQRNLRSDDDAEPNGFWSRVDPGVFTSRWAESVGPDRVTVIALEEGDPHLLPSTFEKLLGLPSGLLDLSVPNRANRGLTQVEATLLRELNAAIKGKLSWEEHNRYVRNGVVSRIIQARKPDRDEGKPGLPAWAVELAATETRRGAEALRASEVRVVGDLDAMCSAKIAVQVGPAPTEVPLDLAVQAVLGAVAAGAHGRSSLDDPRGPAAGPQLLRETTTRDLASLLTRRVRAGLRRRGRRYLSRRSPASS